MSDYSYEEVMDAQVSAPRERIQFKNQTNPHYTNRVIQPWAAMSAWMSPEQYKGFLLGNAIKYLARCNHKGDWKSDLEKAKHYIEKLLDENNC